MIRTEDLRAICNRTQKRRKVRDYVARGVLLLASLFLYAPIIAVLGYVVVSGIRHVNLAVFTQLPMPVGEAGGGVGNGIAGTGLLLAMALGIGAPWGVLIGLYLSESKNTRVSSAVRFAADLLTSVPSIVIGLTVYELVVVPMGHFSAFAGSVALGIIMTPSVARTTEDLLRMVPISVREAGLALGLPRWRVTLLIVLRSAKKGVVTAILIAVARVAGETAPLLFTAFGSRFWSTNPLEPTAALPLQIYNYSISPFEDWHHKAWASAFVLIVFVSLISFTARIFFRLGDKA